MKRYHQTHRTISGGKEISSVSFILSSPNILRRISLAEDCQFFQGQYHRRLKLRTDGGQSRVRKLGSIDLFVVTSLKTNQSSPNFEHKFPIMYEIFNWLQIFWHHDLPFFFYCGRPSSGWPTAIVKCSWCLDLFSRRLISESLGQSSPNLSLIHI